MLRRPADVRARCLFSARAIMAVPWTGFEEAEPRTASGRETAAPDAAAAESTAEPAVRRSLRATGRSTAQHLGMMALNFG